jgi:hypothetical protein
MSLREELMMKVFLSHVSDEGLLALVLKEWIQTTFIDKFKVFVSSDIQNIAAGDKWLDNLGRALSGADVLIVLCSPYSVTRPWVNFEVGSAWVKRIPIIPVCHSGQRLDNLPSPLSSFQGLDIESPTFPNTLVQNLAKRARIRKAPKIDQKEMQKEIKATLRKIKGTRPAGTGASRPSQDKIAVILKKIAISNNEDCTCTKLAKSLKMGANDLDVYLRHLIDRKLITGKTKKDSDCWYVTTASGRRYLIQQKLL